MAVRTRTVEKALAEGGDAKIEQYLDGKGIKWTFKAKIEPAGFDEEKSLHNQVRFVPVDDKRVDTYAEAMRHGDKFPPVIAHIVRGKLVIADGNHRLQASIKAKKPLDVYDITGADPSLITQVGYEANTKHGWPTSEAERIQQALWLMDNGATIQTAAAALVVPQNALKKASQKKGTDQRFREAGIAPLVIEKLPESVKWRLAMVSTDEGFVALTDLVAKASLGVDMVFQMVTEINEHRSSAKQVAYVEAQREVYSEEISASGGGVLVRKPMGPKARISMSMTTIMNLPEDTGVILTAYQGAEKDDAAKKMRATARRLNEIAKALTA